MSTRLARNPSQTDIDLFRLCQACPTCDRYVRRPGMSRALRNRALASGLTIGRYTVSFMADYHDHGHDEAALPDGPALARALAAVEKPQTWPVGLALGFTRSALRKAGRL